MVCMPYREWVRRLGASLPKRICCFMVWTCRGSNRIQGCGATLVKPVGSPDHKVINYAEESATNGLAGMKVTNTRFDLGADNPFFLIAGGTLMLDATNTFSGNKPSSQGGGTMTGLTDR